jgi:hypothetical protein
MPITGAVSYSSFPLTGQRIAGGMSLRRARARLSLEKWFAAALSDDGVPVPNAPVPAVTETP